MKIKMQTWSFVLVQGDGGERVRMEMPAGTVWEDAMLAADAIAQERYGPSAYVEMLEVE